MTTDAGHTHRNKAELRQLLSDRDAEIARQSAELQARDLLIEKLKLQLANLRRQRFGIKSEALDKIIDQLELALVEAEAAAEQHDCGPPPAETEAKQQPARKPLPDHLPREDAVLCPGETCQLCGGALRGLGEDVSETLEYVPGRFKVIRTVRPKLSCRCCETIHQVPAPSMPMIRRSRYSRREPAKPRPEGCGFISGMNGIGLATIIQQSSTNLLRIDEASGHKIT